LLLYRGTRDGLSASTFHEKYDGKDNTITIIKNNLNYIFGGFTSSRWSNNGGYIPDPNAFIFTLRSNATTYNNKLKINTVSNAIRAVSSYGPTFGSGMDIYIRDQSNIYTGSSSSISSYSPPSYPTGVNRTTFLAGSFNTWLTTEVEVYQI
jgi:hypothetical protein